MNPTLEKTISKLDLDELMEAQRMIADMMGQKRQEKKLKLAEEIRGLAAQHGLSFSDIVWGDEDKSKKRNKAKKIYKAKYQNPNNPTEKWAGIGKHPRWVRDLLSNGVPLDQLLIRAE
jgi:DNA-binding protein H-NS